MVTSSELQIEVAKLHIGTYTYCSPHFPRLTFRQCERVPCPVDFNNRPLLMEL